MKRILFSVAALVAMQFGANAQISTLPATQSFTDAFSATTGTNVVIYPNYTAAEVADGSRMYRDIVDFSSAPAALSLVPTGSFDGALTLDFNLANYKNVNLAFVAKSKLNGTGNRFSTITVSASIDGGTTWIGAQTLATLPNEDQTAFTNYSYAFPAETNNQAAVKLKITVGTSATPSTASGTRARVVIDDLSFTVTATAQLAVSTTALSFTQTLGVPAQPQVVSVSGINLAADAALTVAAPYEISLTANSGYATSLTIPQASGSITSTNVYVRLNGTAAAATAPGTLTATSGTSTVTVALTGTTIASTATNPQPFDLSKGNYSFTSWAADAAAGTYPANMVFWTHATTDPTIDVPFNEDYTCLYSLTSRSRFSGQGDAGISMVNTGNSQYTGVCDGTDPTQATGDTVLNGRAGAVVLAINTTGRQDIVVNWTGATIAKNNRVYGLRLQYKIGAGDVNANWTDIANGDDAFTQYTSGEDATTEKLTTALPAAVNNLPVVQLRWVYTYVETGVTGSRAEVALDDVTVTTKEILSADDFTANTFAMYPNPATTVVNFSKPLAVTVYDFTGKVVFTSANKEITSISTNGLAAGIYLVKTTNGAAKKLIVK